MRYFCISNGLRGMYLADNANIIACKTHKQLRTVVENEVYDLRDAGFIGASKRNVTRFIADAWRSKSVYDTVLPLRPEHDDSYSYGLMIGNSSKADWKAQQDSDNA